MYVNDTADRSEHPSSSDIRYFFFRHRDHIPAVVAVAALVGLWLYHPDFAAARAWLAWTSIAVSILCILAGEAMRIWSVGYSGTTTRAKKLKARGLATTGPYAVTRNPIYVGNFLLGLGFVLIPRVAWLLGAYLVMFIVQYSLIVSIEEQFLTSKFGDAYREYQKKVRRFLPSPAALLRALKGEGSEGFSWKALRGEKWTLLNMVFAGTVLIALNFWLRRGS